VAAAPGVAAPGVAAPGAHRRRTSADTSMSGPSGSAGTPDPVTIGANAGWVATTTSCPAARNAHASGTIGW
jgi:hypothetical protein